MATKVCKMVMPQLRPSGLQNLLNYGRNSVARYYSTVGSSPRDYEGEVCKITHPDYFYFHNETSQETRAAIMSSFVVKREFLTEEEEATLHNEVEPHLQRLHYEEEHWDDAIHGFRETERSRWRKASSEILKRMQEFAFPDKMETLPQTHVLDLAKTGVIKPHVDSIRFCGNTICGLCLLSDAVMRLVHVEDKKQVVDIMLNRRSLYIMRDEARYDYTHEVLGEEESYFGTLAVPRARRISIMCRNYPKNDEVC